MKNRIIAALLLSGILMTACADETATAPATDTTAHATSTEDSTTSESSQEADTQTGADESDNALYESFLQNGAKVIFDASKDNANYRSPDGVSGGEYTLQELTDAIREANKDEAADDVSLDEIQYAYIDCGNDGSKELLLSISTSNKNLGEGWIQKVVVKDIDGNLNSIYSCAEWLRDVVAINEGGYIQTSGGDGYGNYGFTKGFINSDGDMKYLSSLYVQGIFYSDETGGRVWYNDSDLELPTGLGLGDNYCFVRYDIKDPSSDAETSYYSYIKILDEYGNKINYFDWDRVEVDESIYDDSNPLKQFLSSEGIQIYTLSELEQMAQDNEEAAGVTEEIRGANDPELNKLDYNF